MAVEWVGVAILLAAVSGVPGLFLPRLSMAGQRLAAGLALAAAATGLTGAVVALRAPDAAVLPWPAVGGTLVGVDALSALFLAPVFLVGGLGSVYGLAYWPQTRHPGNGRQLRLFWGLLVAGMALLVISRHALAFLLGWEVMALSAFFLVATEDHRETCRRDAWVYLVATHVATLTLFALFSLWRQATGSYALEPAAALDPATKSALFLLALFGFGLKAGMMPLHFWLPGAHASAPSHVSALLSGVMLKMGIYGLVRFLALVPDPPSVWGGLVLTLGAVSGLLGVAFAIGQHDLKRLLAYHSVENIGIILMGLGLALLGRAQQQPAWVVLGLAGCLLHVWNHALFKSLLFLSAGAVIHGTRTRDLDRLGGLARTMPWTAALFLVGAVAICGLPPLNGFVSELFVYLGLLGSSIPDRGAPSAAVVAAPVLAMSGALALACFVKVYGAVFLGVPRTPACARAHESPLAMRAPMAALAAGCVVIGLAPVVVSPVLDGAIGAWGGAAAPRLATLAPLATVGSLSLVVVVAAGLLATLGARRLRLGRAGLTWDCGYARPTSRMQYTASSFGQSVVGMFAWALRPRRTEPRVDGLFPATAGLHTAVADVVLDGWLRPAASRIERACGWFRRFQQGLTQDYVLYILVAVALLLGLLLDLGRLKALLNGV